jgi:hypothetical protein
MPETIWFGHLGACRGCGCDANVMGIPSMVFSEIRTDGNVPGMMISIRRESEQSLNSS